jgi:hypothetical protein
MDSKDVPLSVKCYQTESFMKGNGSKRDCHLVLKNCHSHPSLHPQLDQSAAIHIKARPSTSQKLTTH